MKKMICQVFVLNLERVLARLDLDLLACVEAAIKRHQNGLDVRIFSG